ncbi:MAG: phage/plasmid primase, P4 family, partial [Desulfobulbaceae bacterium]|nr:phage/plasmid primase, P4 family [Desulfobulbaceae bacterium]
MTEKEMLAAVIEYTKRGWVVHPLSKPVGDIKKSPGKKPILREWEQLKKTPDLSAFPPGYNIGLVCGKASGVTIIDVDSDLFMQDVFNGMEADIGTLRSHRTKGRCHVFFKYNPRLPSSKHHALDLEILNNGNTAVLPPSKHISGDVYVWDEPDNSDLKEMPIKIEENLIRLFRIETELGQFVKKSRHCFRDVLSRKPKPDMHGSDGRQYMMAVCNDLKSKGAKEEHALMFAKMMYGHDGYDEEKTLDEWRKLDSSKTWRCDTLSSTLPGYVDPDRCEKCARRKEKYAEEKGGKLNEVLGDAIKGVFFQNKLSLAAEMQKRFPIFYDTERNYWLWNHEKTCWERRDETDVLNATRHATQEDVLSSKIRSEILTAIQLTGRERAPRKPNKTWIHFKDKVYDLKTKEFFDATPEYFFTSPIAYALGTSRETPVIDNLFIEWVGEKEAPKLYEIIAYSLLDDYPIHRMFWLIGSGRNGKGQFFKIITKLLGVWNTTTSTLERLLESRFEVATLYTKKVVFMGETDFATLKNTAELKRLTGDDMIRGEMKFKDVFDFWNTAKLIISTNSLPQTLDKTDAFFGRSIIFEFVNRYEISKSVVDTIPEVEFENLALKCVGILSDLLLRGTFKDEGTIEVKAKRYSMHSEHVIQFLAMTYKEDVN